MYIVKTKHNDIFMLENLDEVKDIAGNLEGSVAGEVQYCKKIASYKSTTMTLGDIGMYIFKHTHTIGKNNTLIELDKLAQIVEYIQLPIVGGVE